jgi:pyroglutamyl-peptidase
VINPRVYPVEFSTIRDIISMDMARNYDFAIHMGQAPGYSAVTLEAIGINVAVERGQAPELGVPLVPGGAAAYTTQLPLADWAAGLRRMGIPASVSYHAGTYLCNAALYLSLFESEKHHRRTQSAFLHLPMATEQVATMKSSLPSLPLEAIVTAVRWILEQL